MEATRDQKSSVIRKIEALLNITIDKGATEAEAMSAMARARELMAKYHVSMSAVETSTGAKKDKDVHEINSNVTFTTYSNIWSLRLAQLVAKYHKCEVIIHSYYKRRAKSIIFVGEGGDAEIVSAMFKKMHDCIQPKVLSVINSTWNQPGISHSDSYRYGDCWIKGFMDGLRDYYEEQNKQEESMALMMITPVTVTNHLSKYTKRANLQNSHRSYVDGSEQYQQGYREGKSYNVGKITEGQY